MVAVRFATKITGTVRVRSPFFAAAWRPRYVGVDEAIGTELFASSTVLLRG